MAWFRNFYLCERCNSTWIDEWSCACDDDCPYCGTRHMSPLKSDDLTEIIERDGGEYVVRRSPDAAEYEPDYRDLGRFPTCKQAEAFLGHY